MQHSTPPATPTCSDVVLLEVKVPSILHRLETEGGPGTKPTAIVKAAQEPLDHTEEEGGEACPAQDLDFAHGLGLSRLWQQQQQWQEQQQQRG